MADTKTQREIQDWIRENWLPSQFASEFSRKDVALDAGGKHKFAAVSTDNAIVVTISTGGGRTATGRRAVGPHHKIRSDVLALQMTGARAKVVVVTDETLYADLKLQQDRGLLPRDLRILHASIPDELSLRLRAVKKTARKEVTPGASGDSDAGMEEE